MKNPRRVVITGLGVVSPIGTGKDAFWGSLIAGQSGVDWIASFDASAYPCKVAAEVRGFQPSDFMTTRTVRMVGRFSQLALASVRLAVEDANLPNRSVAEGQRVGVCFGTATSGLGDIGEDNHRSFLATGSRLLNPLAMLQFSTHAATSNIARELSISGPSTSIASGCATGLDTVLWGTSQIRRGVLDIAIVGASEAPISEFIFSLFCAGNFLSTWQGSPEQASRPYDFLRSGLVLGEAAATLILENYEHAVARGANIYCEVLGIGSASEGGFAGQIKDIYRQGLEGAMSTAFTDASILPTNVDHINSHGNSTKNDDAAETAAYKSIFGGHAYNISITSIKGAIGQPLAAGGVLQLATSALSIAHQEVPPTLNQQVGDPDCDLDYVPNRSRKSRIRYALAHSHSLGGVVPGTHTAVLLSTPNIG